MRAHNTMRDELADLAEKARSKYPEVAEAVAAHELSGPVAFPWDLVRCVGFSVDETLRRLKESADMVITLIPDGPLTDARPQMDHPDFRRYVADKLGYRPTVVCLCGSTRFMPAFREANLRETLAGRIVLSVGCDTKSDQGLGLTVEVKAMLDELHLRKIDLADEILVLNCRIPYCTKCEEFRLSTMGCTKEHAWDGTLRPYIGESTRREIAYAAEHGKKVRYLEEMP